jgi:hypothetical protein
MASNTSAAKAIVSALLSGAIAFISALLTAIQGPTASSQGLDSVTDGQWLTAILAGLVALATAGGLTYAVPNQPK